MQNEKSQIQKVTYCVILFHDILKGKTRRQKSNQYLKAKLEDGNLISSCLKLMLGVGDRLQYDIFKVR